MGVAFDYAPERPEHIDNILNGLDRYNPETTSVFQEYVAQQCADQTYDCYANLALLKLYVGYIYIPLFMHTCENDTASSTMINNQRFLLPDRAH